MYPQTRTLSVHVPLAKRPCVPLIDLIHLMVVPTSIPGSNLYLLIAAGSPKERPPSACDVSLHYTWASVFIRGQALGWMGLRLHAGVKLGSVPVVTYPKSPDMSTSTS